MWRELYSNQNIFSSFVSQLNLFHRGFPRANAKNLSIWKSWFWWDLLKIRRKICISQMDQLFLKLCWIPWNNISLFGFVCSSKSCCCCCFCCCCCCCWPEYRDLCARKMFVKLTNKCSNKCSHVTKGIILNLIVRWNRIK